MIVTSSDFKDYEMIPKKHTGFGADVSPKLMLKDIPEKTVSIAIIMEDLDVPFIGEFPHWIIWNIPPVTVIPQGIPKGKLINNPIRAFQGKAWGKHAYRGPKQPPFIHKTHRYRFSVFALDRMLDISPHANKAELIRAMSAHVLEKAELVGLYDPLQKPDGQYIPL